MAERAPSAAQTAEQRDVKPKILIAGAGIGGLVLAVGLLNKGFDVQIFERDLTAIRGEGKYRGPIQVGSLRFSCFLSGSRLRIAQCWL